MKKMTYFVMALALVLGLAQCKKEQMPADNQTEGIRITLDVNGGNSNSRVIVDPAGAEGYATVDFEANDVIYVGYKVNGNNALVGILNYNGGTFSGSVNIPEIVPNEHLHFYFLGGVGFEPTVDGNTATVVISDQTQRLPVISYAPSKQAFTGAGAYSATLQNKVSIMKFDVDTPSTEAICITGMNNKVTVDFTSPSGTDNGFAYDKEGEGVIEMPAKGAENVTWAIVLPQGPLSVGAEGTAFTYDGYKGNRPALEAIASNQYITTVVDALNVSTFDINYMPLTFEAKTAGSKVTFNAASSIPTITMQYNTYDGTGWKPYTSGTTITLANVNDKVSFRGDNNTLSQGLYSNQFSRFTGSGQCNIYGNIMSLLYSTDYATATILKGDHTFCNLFYANMSIYSHPNNALVLPATTLTDYCYQSMFYACNRLTSAPALPATTLTHSCYYSMFDDCSNLTSAPILSATTLADHCYEGMFRGCGRLTTAPALPAETLAPHCYSNMFRECSKLATAPTLSSTSLADHCYEEMFYGCSSLNSAPALPAETLTDSCYKGMFYRCSSLNSAPTLSSTSLADHCYAEMFSECSDLESFPALPAETLAPYCYEGMFQRCNFVMYTAPELPAQTLVEGCYKGMFSGCEIRYIKCLATDISAPNCTAGWVENITDHDSTCTFVKAASMTSWPSGDSGIPYGWTVQNAN